MPEFNDQPQDLLQSDLEYLAKGHPYEHPFRPDWRKFNGREKILPEVRRFLEGDSQELSRDVLELLNLVESVDSELENCTEQQREAVYTKIWDTWTANPRYYSICERIREHLGSAVDQMIQK